MLEPSWCAESSVVPLRLIRCACHTMRACYSLQARHMCISLTRTAVRIRGRSTGEPRRLHQQPAQRCRSASSRTDEESFWPPLPRRGLCGPTWAVNTRAGGARQVPEEESM
jgi:hypothetical protein